MTIAEKLTKIAENVPKVYAQGQQDEQDTFWDTYQQAYQGVGQRSNYSSAFFQRWWNDTTYNPKYDMVITDGASSMYQASQITDTKVKITLDCTSSNMFFGCKQLKTIPYLKLTENATLPKAFLNCTGLENITFDGVIACDVDLQYSTKLTRASIESIMTHLWSCGYEYNEDCHTLCEWNGTTLVCSIGDRYRDPIELSDALFTVYNLNTGEEIASNWAVGHSAVEFTNLDKNIVYAVVATEVFDVSGCEYRMASVAYSEGNSPWGSKTLTLSQEAVDMAFGFDDLGIWVDGSGAWEWLDLVADHPEWLISLV